MKNEFEEILTRSLNKKLTITYIIPNDTLRETSGILVSITNDVITMKICDDFGDIAMYNLNRSSCQIVSIIVIGG